MRHIAIFLFCFCPLFAEKLNKPVDLVLKDLTELLDSEGYNEIPVPDLQKAGLICRNGTIGNLTTIFRTGPVKEIVRNDKIAIIEGSLGMKFFNLVYHDCTLFHIFHSAIHLENKQNSIFLKIKFEKIKKSCHATLKDFKLVKFEKPKLFTTESWISSIEDHLLNWLLNHFQEHILSSIYDKIWSVAAKVSGVDVCKNIPRS